VGDLVGSIVVLGLVGVVCLALAGAIAVGFLRSAHGDPVAEAEPEVSYIDVEFTVYRPNQVAADTRSQLLFFAHLAEPAADAHPGTPHPRVLVEELAAARVDEDTSSLTDSWAEGEGPLLVVPELEGSGFVPARSALGWPHPVAALEFRFTPRPPDRRPLRGSVGVWFGDVELARIPLEIPVGEEPIEGLVPLDPQLAAPLGPAQMPPPPPRRSVSWGWALAALLGAGATVVVALVRPGPEPTVAPPEPAALRVTPLRPDGVTVELASRPGEPAVSHVVVACPEAGLEVRADFEGGIARVDALPDGSCEARFPLGGESPVPVEPGDDLVCRLARGRPPACYPR